MNFQIIASRDYSLVRNAELLAFAAHAGQERKYTRETYFVHCVEVAELVWKHTGCPVTTAAALLHDTLEDTKLPADAIAGYCNPEVLKLVLEVTDVSKPEDGNREARKQIDRNHLMEASPGGKSIKLADLISNTRSIVQHDPKFARVYLREKDLLLPFLVDGEATLFQLAFRTLQEGQSRLVQHAITPEGQQ